MLLGVAEAAFVAEYIFSEGSTLVNLGEVLRTELLWVLQQDLGRGFCEDNGLYFWKFL